MLIAATLSSSYTWLRSRRIRTLLLCACSPILCLCLPLLCAVELCLRFFRCRRGQGPVADEAADEKLRRCEEGFCGCAAAAEPAPAAENGGDQVVLLQRYLEDQLLLVLSMYDCGDDDDNDVDDDDDDDDEEKPLL